MPLYKSITVAPGTQLLIWQITESFEELSKDAQSFINNIEDKLNTPVTIIGTGPAVNEIIDRRK